MFNCYIIDDEQASINILSTYINKMPELKLVGSTTNPLIGIEQIKSSEPDIVFVDIQMEEMNGIEVASVIDPKIKVIFCTAYSEFAVASYELNALDYLVKPIGFARFVKAMNKASEKTKPAKQQVTSNDGDFIMVRTEYKGKMVKIDLPDVDYIEAKNNYIALYRGKSKTTVYGTMKEMEERLPTNMFMRIHKSFIVSLRKISTVEGGSITLKNLDVRIPLGESYKTIFMERMKDKLVS